MIPGLEQTDHRPWPMPDRPWAMAMGWHDLLFAHWDFDPKIVRPFIPAPLTLDTFDGRAWVGVVPFRMTGVRPRLTPGLFAMGFPELNVRTYARSPDGRTGVWFFSLDATSRLAVRIARSWYNLPYFDADIRYTQHDKGLHYQSTRTHRGAPPAVLDIRYGPAGPVTPARPGTLEHWLTERYCLYSQDKAGRVYAGDVHHGPWPLQPAWAEFSQIDMTRLLGAALPDTQPLLHFAKGVDVIAWTLRPVS